jgi:ribose transport system ATP-binding protein
MNLEEITKRMLGRNLQDIYTWEQKKLGKELIRLERLSSHVGFQDISFTLREGEILGIAGVVGAKRTELVHAIIGALPIYSGSIHYRGKSVKIRRPKDAIKFGIGVLHEDKSKHGMFHALSVAKNMTSVGLEQIRRRWGLSLGFEGEVVEKFRKRLNIQTASIENKINVLSGGNQQKVMFSKMMFANSEVLILDEPTKGIDIGAKQEIFKLINDLANEGKGIIFISSELPEVVGMCDRVLVMKRGKIVEEIFREEVSEEKILRSAL